MATSTNEEGYEGALHQAWKSSGHKLVDTPCKSSLSESRTKVSFKFFEDIYRDDLSKLKRKKFNGLHIYAVDGDQLELPASLDVIAAGFKGYPGSENRETHYPKLYTCQALDIINGTVCDFRYSKDQDETHLAREIASNFEKNSLAIYDRLHCGYHSFLPHFYAENYFLIRARLNGNGVADVVKKFAASKKRAEWVLWRPQPGERKIFQDLWVRLIKVKNPRSGEDLIFVTNLPAKKFSHREISLLYGRRWEIETSFRTLTATLKLNQWHSKKINGVFQEIFALLWLVNQVKMWMSSMTSSKEQAPLQSNYCKANFKLCFNLVVENMRLLIRKKWKELFEILSFWFRRTLERRKHFSRSYPRVVRHRGREYKHANMVPRRLAA